MTITKLSDIEVGDENNGLLLDKYSEGIYLVNDNLIAKTKDETIYYLYSGVSVIFSESYLNEDSKEPERGDTISEEFLLKVLAVSKEPSLVKEI